MSEASRKMLIPENFPLLMGFLDEDGHGAAQAAAAMAEFVNPVDKFSALEARAKLESLVVDSIAAFWISLVNESPAELRSKLVARFYRPQCVDRIYACRALMSANYRNMTLEEGRSQVASMITFLDEVGLVSDAFDDVDSRAARSQSPESKDKQTCSCCFQLILSRNGEILGHLFDSSGETSGQPLQNCMGSKFPPLEVNPSGLQWRIGNLKHRLQEKREDYANRSSLGEIKIRHVKITKGDPTWDDEFSRHVITMEQEIRALEANLKRATEFVLNQKNA